MMRFLRGNGVGTVAAECAGVAVLAAGCVLLAVFSVYGGDAAGDGVDAVTAASVDSVTGASKQLEPIKVTDKFSVAYAMNRDGALFITAADLTDAYRRDELASDSLFKGKVMLVKGEVDKTSKPDAPKPWLSLKGDAGSGKKVRCSLKKGQLADRDVKEGDSVQIRGVCDGMKLSVSLADAEIAE